MVDFLECRLAIPIFSSTTQQKIPKSLFEPLEALKRKNSIVWIMVQPDPLMNEPVGKRSVLRVKTFFSTLEYAAVPKVASDLFIPLTKQLQEEWDGLYKAAEQHLNEMVEQGSLL